MNFLVSEQAVLIDLPSVQNLAAQGQDSLKFLVTAHLGRTASRVTLDQKQFRTFQIVRLAIRQLAGQHGHARALAFLHFLRRTGTGLSLTHSHFG